MGSIETLTEGYVFLFWELFSPVSPPCEPFSLLYRYLILLVGCSRILRKGLSESEQWLALGGQRRADCLTLADVFDVEILLSGLLRNALRELAAIVWYYERRYRR